MSQDTFAAAAQRALDQAVTGGRRIHEPTGQPLIDALVQCARAQRITVPEQRLAAVRRLAPSTPAAAASALGLSLRVLDLESEVDWWRTDSDAILARVEGDWVALVGHRGRLEIRSADGRATRLRDPRAVERRAWSVCPALPDGPVRLRSLMRQASSVGNGRDFSLLALTAAVSVLLGTVVPLFTGRIIGELVPSGASGRIWVLGAVLALVAVSTSLVLVVQGLLSQRVAARADLALSRALLQRIVRLPLAFHRVHQPGELAQRLTGMDAVPATVASVLPLLLSAVSLFAGSVIVLVLLAPGIAVLVVTVCGVLVLVGGIVLVRQYRQAADYTSASLRLAGSVFAMLGGVAKIRVAKAERRMYSRWLFAFAQQQSTARTIMNYGTALSVVAAIPAATVTLIVVGVAARGGVNLGVFTAVVSAAAQVAGSVALAFPVIGQLLRLGPTLASVRPIVASIPEPVGSALGDPGTLRGDVEMERVTFGYGVDAAPVLADISLTFRRGAMTAIVGPSGCGKSTLLRLLLGLERPSSGRVLYDGRSLDRLDAVSVRRQIGVVPQDASLTAGTIAENILGTNVHLTEQDAWAAAEAVGLADDLRAMPMGMATLAGDGAATFSGGQRQRILLARALVHRPSIVLLDEATSALDNVTQQIVAESLAALQATRIVVAHRLSTIRDADAIIVLQEGRVVEEGTFDELVALNGVFRTLVDRQV